MITKKLNSILLVFTLFFGCSSINDEKFDQSNTDENSENMESNIWPVSGYLDDVSSTGNLILYRTPFDWLPDEYKEGRLLLFNVENGETIELADTIMMNYPKSIFINDSLVAISSLSIIHFLNLKTRNVNSVNLELTSNEHLLQLAFNNAKTKIALLIQNFDLEKVILRIIDLEQSVQFEIDHNYDIEIPINSTGQLLWRNNALLYSFQNELYFYQINNTNTHQVSDNVAFFYEYLYSIDNDRVLFYEKKEGKFILNEFNVSSLSNNVVEGYSHSGKNINYMNLYLTNHFGVTKTIIRVNDDLYRYSPNSINVTNELVLFENDEFLISNDLNIEKNELIIKQKK